MHRARCPKEEADEIEQLQAGEAQQAEPQRPRAQAVPHAAAEKDRRGPLEQTQRAAAGGDGRGPRRRRSDEIERGEAARPKENVAESEARHRRPRRRVTAGGGRMRAEGRIHHNRRGLGAHARRRRQIQVVGAHRANTQKTMKRC